MTAKDTADRKVLSRELPDVRLREVADAVSDALRTGKDAPRIKALDLGDGLLDATLEKAVADALTISPLKALIKAWTGIQQIAGLLGPDGPQDGKSRDVAIAGHSLRAGFTPHIVIELGNIVDVSKLPIPVTLTFKIDGLIVTIMDREITGIAAGRAKPTVEIKVDDVTVIKETLPTLDLPLEMKLRAHALEAA